MPLQAGRSTSRNLSSAFNFLMEYIPQKGKLILPATARQHLWRLVMPISQHHLYEIHTAAQSDLVSAVLSVEHIVELARLRDFL